MRARRSGTTAATCCSRVEVSLLPLWEKVADEVRRMRGLYPRRQTPHPSRCSCASIADAKHRRPFLSTAADGRLCHLLPQGEKGNLNSTAARSGGCLFAPGAHSLDRV